MIARNSQLPNTSTPNISIQAIDPECLIRQAVPQMPSYLGNVSHIQGVLRMLLSVFVSSSGYYHLSQALSMI